MKWTSWTRNYTVNLLLQSVVLTIIIVLRNNWLSFKCINQHTGSYFHLSASQLHSAVFEHTKYVAQLREEKLISHNPDTACTKTRHIDNVHYNHNKPSTVFKPSGACEGCQWNVQEAYGYYRTARTEAKNNLALIKKHTYTHPVIHINTSHQSRDDGMLGRSYWEEISQHV